jgi:hypothetical protein
MSVKITFGMIVFNAEKNLPNGMLSACIQNIYDFAHEIIIVEGATKAINHYFDGDTSKFTNDGKSNDRTIEIIKSFPDPKNKIKLIESKGFWDGKTQMCNEYAKIALNDPSKQFVQYYTALKLFRLLKNLRQLFSLLPLVLRCFI